MGIFASQGAEGATHAFFSRIGATFYLRTALFSMRRGDTFARQKMPRGENARPTNRARKCATTLPITLPPYMAAGLGAEFQGPRGLRECHCGI